MSEIIHVARSTRQAVNKLKVWWYQHFGELDRDEDVPRNLRHGVKFRVEEGVGIFVEPRTQLDDGL